MNYIYFILKNSNGEVVQFGKLEDNEQNRKLFNSWKENGYEETDKEYIFLNNKFVIKDYSQNYILDELKLAKRAEINQARDAAEQGGFEYLEKVFDSDQVSCIRISSAAQAMQYATDDATITWTCQDNSTVALTKEQLQELIIALANHSNECHKKATELKEKIKNAQTKEELDEIVW